MAIHTILIVDDSPSDIRFMTEALKGSAHETVTLTDSKGVEAAVESERPQLALLDVVMRQADANQSKAAAWLGINRNTLRRKLLDHRLIDVDEKAR